MDGQINFEDIEIGLDLTPVVRKITQESMSNYAEAANGFHPVYVDNDAALMPPFSRVIADGAAPLAFISTLLNEHFGAAWTFWGNISVSFKRTIRLGDTVFTKSKVLGKKMESDKKIVELSISCENQNGDAIVTGKATVSFE